jgi:hypothetical protein
MSIGTWFSAQEKAELWQRWKAGETISAIPRAMGKGSPHAVDSGEGARRRRSEEALPVWTAPESGTEIELSVPATRAYAASSAPRHCDTSIRS